MYIEKKINWVYVVLFTAFIGLGIFFISNYFISGYSLPQNGVWSDENKAIYQYNLEKPIEISKTPNGEEYAPDRVYSYRIVIDDAENSLLTSNVQRGWRDEPPLELSPSQTKALNGIYEWKSDIFFKTQRQMFDYICEHYMEMQKYKVGSVPKPVPHKSERSSTRTNIYDEYQDRLYDYLDDPEDEIEYDPEVFDFQDD